MGKYVPLTDTLHNYICDVSVREHPVQTELRKVTAELPGAVMQISPDEGQFLSFLVGLTGAKKIIEIGTFTGYSSLTMALALPEDGLITTCDLNDNEIARAHWEKAGVTQKINFLVGNAIESLETLTTGFDIAFIDADKNRYDDYYEKCLELLNPGGIIIVDNVLWHGEVINTENTKPQTEAIRTLNKKIHADERVDCSLVNVGDGVMLARKR